MFGKFLKPVEKTNRNIENVMYLGIGLILGAALVTTIVVVKSI